MRRLLLLLLTAMILNVSCDNLTKSKSEDTEESDSKAKKKKKKAADEEDEDVAAEDENRDDRNADDEETSNDDDSRSRNNDDEEEDSDSGSWTRSEQKEFMDNCVENTGFSKSKAENYCDCMLKKLQSRYPKATDMNRASDLKGEITDMAPGCLN